MPSSYIPDHQGIRAFLNSSDMVRMVEYVAERIRERAQAQSPVGSFADGDEHPGRYLASWHVRSSRFSGATNDRAEAEVYNDSPEAVWVEYGHHGREPYHTLLRAAVEVRI